MASPGMCALPRPHLFPPPLPLHVPWGTAAAMEECVQAGEAGAEPGRCGGTPRWSASGIPRGNQPPTVCFLLLSPLPWSPGTHAQGMWKRLFPKELLFPYCFGIGRGWGGVRWKYLGADQLPCVCYHPGGVPALTSIT